MTTVVHFKPSSDKDADSVSIEDGLSLLDGLLQNGYDIPYGCKGGVCQSCLLQSNSSKIPSQAQVGLSQAQKDQGLLLSCSCNPIDGLDVQHVDLSGEKTTLKVVEKSLLSDNIFRLRLSSEIQYHAGQFMTLWRDDKVARSYSIASVCDIDPTLEFQIKRIENGAFSDWAWQHLNVGDTLQAQGPIGQCYYTDIPNESPILLAGIGTGLAPLVGIIRDALQQGHLGDISLYVGARRAKDFYLVGELIKIASENKNFHVQFVSLETEESTVPEDILLQGDIYDTIKEKHTSMGDSHIYLCGAESFVKKLKKQCFLGGASMKAIHADPFIPFGG